MANVWPYCHEQPLFEIFTNSNPDLNQNSVWFTEVDVRRDTLH